MLNLVHAQASVRILIVDDDPVLGQLFLDVLEPSGHRCTLTHTGRDALDLVARESFDLVISDLRMPVMSGRELWEELKLQNPSLARTMIFISAEQPEAASCRFLRESGHTYLRKPFDIGHLLAVVEEAPAQPVGRSN